MTQEAARRADNSIEVYAVGLCCASVCAPASLPRGDVETMVNIMEPTGIGSGWQISEHATFKGGEPNPCPCQHNPERQHWLLNC